MSNISLYLGNDTRQSYTYNCRRIVSRRWSIERRQRPWTTSSPDFNVTPLMLDISETVRDTQFQWNRDLHTPYSRVSFRMILIGLEWLSEIFSDSKRRAVSLRQLSILFQVVCTNGEHLCALTTFTCCLFHAIFYTKFKGVSNVRNSAWRCIARLIPSCGICPSVRPSVTFLYCIEISKRILKLSYLVVELVPP